VIFRSLVRAERLEVEKRVREPVKANLA